MFYRNFDFRCQQWLLKNGYRYLVVGKKLNSEDANKDMFEALLYKHLPKAHSSLLFALEGPEVLDMIECSEPAHFKVNISSLTQQLIAA